MNRIWKYAAAIITAVFICMLIEQQHPAFVQAMTQKSRYADVTSQQNCVIITVRSGQNAAFVSDLKIESREINDAMIQAKQEIIADTAFLPDVEITLLLTNRTRHFRLEQSGNLWNESTSERLILPKRISDKLLRLTEALRTQHYGELITWQDTKLILPNKSIFSVTELETGLTFQVQRRAGSDHADVQPLTKADTRIMKQIYKDRWSWKRKAVLVHAGKGWIAASMNGMPHGGDGIPENGFSGHFCIHFLGSSTHKSDSPDLAHQMMVHKAAGRVKAYFDSASPFVLAKSFVEVMHHQDKELMLRLTEEMSNEKLAYFMKQMESLVSIREQNQQKSIGESGQGEIEPGEALTSEVRLPITIHLLNEPRQNLSYLFVFKRESKQSPWRIQEIIS